VSKKTTCTQGRKGLKLSDKNNLHINEKGSRIEQQKQTKHKGREGLELNDKGHKFFYKKRFGIE
jgi:hypothetical protein